jgi:hypothetical protein
MRASKLASAPFSIERAANLGTEATRKSTMIVDAGLFEINTSGQFELQPAQAQRGFWDTSGTE